MIEYVKIENSEKESLELSLSNPVSSGMFIRSIKGLGPPSAAINMSEYATTDGGRFNSSRGQNRNVVLRLGFLPNPTIEATRLLSYKMFPVKEKVRITVKTDTRTVYADGYVENNEPDIFSRKEGCSISVLCPAGEWFGVRQQYTPFFGVNGGFEFPFSNESITEPLIELSTLDDGDRKDMEYNGDREIGAIINIVFYGPCGNVTVYHTQSRKEITIDLSAVEAKTGTPIGKYDEIIISTVRGEKACILARNGESINILSCLTADSEWFLLQRGKNTFVTTVASNPENARISMTNNVSYLGV